MPPLTRNVAKQTGVQLPDPRTTNLDTLHVRFQKALKDNQYDEFPALFKHPNEKTRNQFLKLFYSNFHKLVLDPKIIRIIKENDVQIPSNIIASILNANLINDTKTAVVKIIIENGLLPVRIQDLNSAVMYRNIPLVKFFIDHNPKLVSDFSTGSTVLMTAMTNNSSDEIIQLLLEKGAGKTLTMKDLANDMTALMLAAQNSFPRTQILINYMKKHDLMKIINQISNGIRVRGKQMRTTALDYATIPEVKTLLTSNGAMRYFWLAKLKNPKSVEKRRSKRFTPAQRRSYNAMDEEFNYKMLKCKNEQTPIANTDISTLKYKDIVKVPSGHCYEKNELVEFIQHVTFTNLDPNTREIMFTKENVVKYPVEVQTAVKNYFERVNEQRNKVALLLKNNMRLLYTIGRTGRICYFNNISASQEVTGAPFEYSQHAIEDLNEELHKLGSEDLKTMMTIKEFDAGKMSVTCILNDAKKGAMCIHGVGLRLMTLFVNFFTLIEKLGHPLQYDPLRTGLLFMWEGGKVIFKNINNRMYANPHKYYYKVHIEPVVSKLASRKTSSLLLVNNADAKTKSFDKTCSTDASDVSDVTDATSWASIPDWRKIGLSKPKDASKYPCFDIYYLIKTMTRNLCTMKSFNPYPLYPRNPITSAPLSKNELLTIRRIVDDNLLYINKQPLSVFLKNADDLWLNSPSREKEEAWQKRFVALAEQTMRFKLVHILDGDDLRISGVWIDKSDAETRNEIMLRKLTKDNLPDEVTDSYYYMLNTVPLDLVET